MGKVTLETKFNLGDPVFVCKNIYDTAENNFRGKVGNISYIRLTYHLFEGVDDKDSVSRKDTQYGVRISENFVWEFPEDALSLRKK